MEGLLIRKIERLLEECRTNRYFISVGCHKREPSEATQKGAMDPPHVLLSGDIALVNEYSRDSYDI